MHYMDYMDATNISLISFSCTLLLYKNFNFSYSWGVQNYAKMTCIHAQYHEKILT